MGDKGSAASGHRPRQLSDPPVKARLVAEQLAEWLGRTIRDTYRSLAVFGLQLRNNEDDWQLTEDGCEWGIALPLCSRGKRRQRILWDPAVAAFLHQTN